MTEAAIFSNILETTETGNAGAVKEQQAASAGFEEQVNIARKLLPMYADTIDTVDRLYKTTLDSTCAETRRLANSANPADKQKAGVLMLETCKPAFTAVVEAARR